jgi:uncharacterized protein with GYD domain
MPRYMTLIQWTQQGVVKIKESSSRLDTARKAAEDMGGKIHDWYLLMGKYDGMFISEFPDDETIARFMLAVGAQGNVTTLTSKAFTEQEYRKIIAAIP